MEKRTLRDEGIIIEEDDFLEKRPSGGGRKGSGGKKRRKRKRPQNRKMSPKKMRRLIISGLVGVVVFVICIICFSCVGGNEAENATVNSLYISKDGKITEAIVEDFTESYLDEDELKAFIKEQIDYFQKNTEDGEVKLKKLEVEDGKAKVILTYDSAASYDEFNEVPIFNGTIKESADEEGLLTDMVDVNSVKGDKQITLDTLESDSEYKLLIITEETEIYLENEIVYTSSNVAVSSDCKMAKTDISKGHGYIVYKK